MSADFPEEDFASPHPLVVLLCVAVIAGMLALCLMFPSISGFGEQPSAMPSTIKMGRETPM